MQEAIKSKKDPEAEEAEGTSQPLKTEKTREEGTGSRKEQERPRGRKSRGYRTAIEGRKTQSGGCGSV